MQAYQKTVSHMSTCHDVSNHSSGTEKTHGQYDYPTAVADVRDCTTYYIVGYIEYGSLATFIFDTWVIQGSEAGSFLYNLFPMLDFKTV